MKRLLGILTAILGVTVFACQSEAPPTPSEQAAEATSAAEPQRVEADEIAQLLAEEDVVLLDVRTAEEIEELGTVEGYIHIPIDELESRLDELPKDKTILTA